MSGNTYKKIYNWEPLPLFEVGQKYKRKILLIIFTIIFSVSPMLDETVEFLERRIKENPSYKYEIIVVSDGSKDNTVKLAESYVEKYGCDKLRCLDLIKNRGKGGAVKLVWKQNCIK